MIKIIKQGKKPKYYKTIYSIKCPNCGCEFECEITDFKSIEKTIGGDMIIDCPCCNKELHTKDINSIEIKEEEIEEIITNLNLSYPSWYVPSKDPCETCPNRFGLRDGLGNPIAGDSPCQWCSNYKWKIICTSKN